jgi:hypothetical protein
VWSSEITGEPLPDQAVTTQPRLENRRLGQALVTCTTQPNGPQVRVLLPVVVPSVRQ